MGYPPILPFISLVCKAVNSFNFTQQSGDEINFQLKPMGNSVMVARVCHWLCWMNFRWQVVSLAPILKWFPAIVSIRTPKASPLPTSPLSKNWPPCESHGALSWLWRDMLGRKSKPWGWACKNCGVHYLSSRSIANIGWVKGMYARQYGFWFLPFRWESWGVTRRSRSTKTQRWLCFAKSGKQMPLNRTGALMDPAMPLIHMWWKWLSH